MSLTAGRILQHKRVLTRVRTCSKESLSLGRKDREMFKWKLTANQPQFVSICLISVVALSVIDAWSSDLGVKAS